MFGILILLPSFIVNQISLVCLVKGNVQEVPQVLKGNLANEFFKRKFYFGEKPSNVYVRNG